MKQIIDKMQLRSRYGEVDKMGYIYHANYVSYCHQARTELLRKLNIHDKALESQGLILPVISFEIKYLKPAYYDELITIKTTIKELPATRLNFEFEISNSLGEKISKATTTVVFADINTRLPKRVPDFIYNAIKNNLKT